MTTASAFVIFAVMFVGGTFADSTNRFDAFLLMDHDQGQGQTRGNTNTVELWLKLRTLQFGDKCDSGLEASGIPVLAKVQEAVQKIKEEDAQRGQRQGQGSTKYSDSTEDLAAEAIDGVAEYVKKIQRSPIGKVCNSSDLLYCDPSSNKCQCGSVDSPKGFSYTNEEGEGCVYEKRSGCSPFDITLMRCAVGSQCVTILDNQKCTTPNLEREVTKYGTRFERTFRTKGYLCFCDGAGQSDYGANRSRFQ